MRAVFPKHKSGSVITKKKHHKMNNSPVELNDIMRIVNSAIDQLEVEQLRHANSQELTFEQGLRRFLSLIQNDDIFDEENDDEEDDGFVFHIHRNSDDSEIQRLMLSEQLDHFDMQLVEMTQMRPLISIPNSADDQRCYFPNNSSSNLHSSSRDDKSEPFADSGEIKYIPWSNSLSTDIPDFVGNISKFPECLVFSACLEPKLDALQSMLLNPDGDILPASKLDKISSDDLLSAFDDLEDLEHAVIALQSVPRVGR